jgi:hypothetical protein
LADLLLSSKASTGAITDQRHNDPNQSSEDKAMNHLDAFLYKKFRTAAVVMTLVILTVALGACQKSEPETEKAAAPGSTEMDKVSEATGEATKAAGEMAEEAIEKTGEAAEAAGEMVEKGIEKAGEAAGAAGEMVEETKDEAVEVYQKGSAAVKEAASQGEDAVETATDAAGGALKGVTLPKTE